MRIVFIILILNSLTGCVGLAVGTYGTHEHKREEFTLDPKRNEFGMGANQSYTTERVAELWGQPDASYSQGTCTVYSYHDGFTWSGMGAFVGIVPLPLVVPSGNQEIRIYFKDNKSIAAVSEYGEVTGLFGYMCGSNECGFHAGAVNEDKDRLVTVNWCD